MSAEEAGVNRRDIMGVSALHHAMCNINSRHDQVVTQQEAVSVLLSARAHVDLELVDGTTALLLASQLGCLPVVQVLLEHKANVNHLNNAGDTAIILAARFRHSSIIELLLEHNAELGKRNNKGASAAVAAAHQPPEMLVANQTGMSENGRLPANVFLSATSVQILMDHGDFLEERRNSGIYKEMKEWCSARKACRDFFLLTIPWGIMRIITNESAMSQGVASRNCFTFVLNVLLRIGLFALLVCIVVVYLPLLLIGCGCSLLWLQRTVKLRLNDKSTLAPKCSDLLRAAQEEAQASVDKVVSTIQHGKWTDSEFPPTPEGCLYPDIEVASMVEHWCIQ